MALTQEQKDFMKQIGESASKDMKKSKILASITTAQAILESGWGKSELAKKAKNLFGIKSNNAWNGETYTVVSKEEVNGKLVDKTSKFRKYNSWAESIADHSDYLCTRSLDGKTKLYKKVVGETDYKIAAKELQKAGYSTYSSYASQLCDLIERYSLDKYDNKEECEMAVRIMLDAGHGGSDPGACNGKREEASDVLKLVLAVGKKLTNTYSNVKVGYTRTNDIFEKPSKKAKDANDFDADYFFSFHRNSASASAKGYETLVTSNTGIKKQLADDINAEMKKIGFVNRGTKERDNLAVLNQTNMKAWLFEVGFISNKTDNALFNDKFNDIVSSFVKVIAKHCGLKKKVQTQVSEIEVPKQFKAGDYNGMVKVVKECAVRTGRGKTFKEIGTLKVGEKVKVLYIAKNDAGNLWGSIDYGKTVGYIYLGNVEVV